MSAMPAAASQASPGLKNNGSWIYTYNHLDWLMSADNLGNNALDETSSYSTTGNLFSRTRGF